MERTQKKGLLGGVLLLSASGILVKLMGFLYRVPLNAVLGDEMANVNAALSVWAVLYTVTTAGIPTALSVLTAEARAEGREPRALLRPALWLLSAVGLAGAVLLLLLAPALSRATAEGESLPALLAIAPALCFVAPACVLRGYCQGEGRMAPTAAAELWEAAGKMGLGLLLAHLALRFGASHRDAAALSLLGIGAGAALSLLSLILALRGRAKVAPARGMGRRILAISLPIMAVSLLLNLSAFADASLMRPLLARAFGDGEWAKQVYSDYSTGALTLFHLPSVFIAPLSVALIPRISERRARGEDAAREARLALRMTSLLGLFAAAVLFFLGRELLSLLFASDPTMVKNAGELLSLLAFAVWPLSLFTVSCGILSCLRLQKKAVPFLLLGLALKVGAALLTPVLGAAAFPLGTLLFYGVGAFGNLLLLHRFLGSRLSLGQFFLRPLAAALLSGGGMKAVHLALHPRLGILALFPALLLGGILGLALAALFGCVGREEWELLPLPRRFFKIKDKERQQR